MTMTRPPSPTRSSTAGKRSSAMGVVAYSTINEPSIRSLAGVGAGVRTPRRARPAELPADYCLQLQVFGG